MNRTKFYNELKALREQMYRHYGTYRDADRVIREMLSDMRLSGPLIGEKQS